MTPEQKAEAIRLRSIGVSWDKIAMRYGVTRTILRSIVDFGSLSCRHALHGGFTRVVSEEPPPADVLEERDRAARQPRSLTAEICKDPPPGRSALDKKRGWYG